MKNRDRVYACPVAPAELKCKNDKNSTSLISTANWAPARYAVYISCWSTEDGVEVVLYVYPIGLFAVPISAHL